MKRYLVLILVLALLLGGCGAAPEATTQATTTAPTEATTEATVPPTTEAPGVYLTQNSVQSPMAYPDYTFDHTATADELRQTAVRAMIDMLSIRWCVDRYYRYEKSGSVSGKDFSHIPNNTYAGMPYTNGYGTLIGWFEYYDPQTGLLSLPGDPQNMNTLVGNSCAACVSAAWIAVCPSISGVVPTQYMIPANGFLPVGDYVIPDTVKNYNEYSTAKIIADNGEDKIIAAYAAVKAADGLVSTPDVHAIMAIEDARVVYLEDGSIDLEKSIIAIADQRAGTSDSFYIQEEDGVTCYYSGRTYHEYTFAQLLKLGYIPVTTAEFLGQAPYVEPSVSYSKGSYDASDMHTGSVTGSYMILVVRAVLTDSEGNRNVLESKVLSQTERNMGLARSFDLSNLGTRATNYDFSQVLETGETGLFSYEVTLANGQTFTVAQVEVTG